MAGSVNSMNQFTPPLSSVSLPTPENRANEPQPISTQPSGNATVPPPANPQPAPSPTAAEAARAYGIGGTVNTTA